MRSTARSLAPERRSPEGEVVPRLLSELRRSGLRLSTQRIEIIRALVRQGARHPTAEEIHQTVRGQGHRVSLATVYNTLERLKSLKLLNELGFPDGPARFDLNLEPHVNLVCLRCGGIEDVPSGRLGRTTLEVCAPAGFQVHRHRFDLYGLCRRCQASGEISPRP
jgi:Fe2+ or Zn2+ uptake regulation protein